MTLVPAPPIADPDDDTSNTYTAATTPPESDATGLHDDYDPIPMTAAQPRSSLKPQPGRTWLIRAVPSGEVITLHGGRIILSQQPAGRASHWDCVKTGGWLGFRNGVSGAYLGRDWWLQFRCSAGWHQMWERFDIRERPEGVGSVLLMEHWGLKRVGVKVDGGVKNLAVIDDWDVDEMVWEFVEV